MRTRFRFACLLPIAVVATYLGLIVVPGMPDDVRLVVVGGAALTLVPLGAAAVLARAAVRRRYAPFWMLAGGCASWGIGNAALSAYSLANAEMVPFPSFADACFLLFLPLAGAVVLSVVGAGSRAVGRLRMLCDSLIGGLALLAAAWPLVLKPAIEESPHLLDRLVACAYPVGDVILLALVVPVIGRAAPCWRPVLGRLAFAFACLTAADVLFALASSTGTWSATNLSSTGWVIAFCALASVARVWPGDEQIEDSRTTPAWHRPASFGLVLITCLPVLLGGLVSFVELIAGRLGLVGGGCVLAVVGLGTARQQLAFWENDSLTRQLESRVARRTAELVELAYTDQLTGLANRASFAKLLAELIDAGQHPIVVLLDLDGFKAVNDTLGHAAGDELLARVAGRLHRAAPNAQLLARLGGDEFAIVLPVDSDPSAEECAAAVLQDLAAPFTIAAGDAHEVRIGASVGIAGLTPPDAMPAELEARRVDSNDVLRDADIAMYAAKAAGRNRWCAFDPVMRRAAENRKSLDDDLHAAVRDATLSLAYQPIVHLRTGRIVGFEALLRWNHPVRGMVPPLQFIPLAEETGLIVPIGAWVLREACRQAVEWKRLLPPGAEFGCGVNLSVSQLRPGLLAVVRSALDSTGLPPDALILEVTESVFMDDDRADPELLQHLRKLGPKIFLDDFGTGFSSLSYLRRFPVDGLKIDRTFVASLGEGDDVLASAIIGLAENLGLGVVAEGIELPSERAALQRLGCQLGQGFGMFVPLSAAEMTAALRSGATVPAQRQPAPRGEDTNAP